MRNVQITDEWLYSQMTSLGDKCLHAMPKEEEIEYEFSERFQQKMKILLRRAELKEKYKIPITAWGRTAASIAVVIIGIFLASLGVEAIRTEIYEFIQQRYKTFTRTEYEVIKSEPVEFVPLYPQYIPEGYELDVCDVDEGSSLLKYRNVTGDGFWIYQELITDELSTYEDSDYVAQEQVEIHGEEAMLGIKKNGAVNIRWRTDTSIYVFVASQINKEECLKICNLLEE